MTAASPDPLPPAAIDLSRPPVLFRTGIGRHGHRRRERYRFDDIWCLHRYRYPCRLILDGVACQIRPGDLSLCPPGCRMDYRFPGPDCEHQYALFHLAGAAGDARVRHHQRPPHAINQALEAQLQRVVDGAGGARSAAALWDLLWRLCDAAGDEEVEVRVARRIDATLGTALSVAALAQEVGLTPDHLTRRFRARYGRTVIGYIREQRLQLAHRLLRRSGMAPAEAAVACGMGDLQYFNKQVRARWGVSPRALCGAAPPRLRPASDRAR